MASLLSLGLLFLLGVMPSFKASNRRANMELHAGVLAQSTLSQAWATPYSELVDYSTTVSQEGIEFQQQVTVTPSADGFTKRVRVELRWSWKGQNFSTFRETEVVKVPRS